MPHAEFQSHSASFDYLKSLEIEERINQIQWLDGTNNALFLLSTNDKTVKLWKVFNKTVRTWETEEEYDGRVERGGGLEGNGTRVRKCGGIRFPTKVSKREARLG